ncbi:MAG: era [Gammaproteobacteria bacterium]|jgi:GTP-binding protein Era|nr:era [Gammaproteobacteria bacterium]
MTHCGYIGIIGRPNVGKSTLLNRFIGMKVSITSRKPQTTREQILGIYTEDDTQYVFIDTPGIHAGQGAYSNRLMNRAAKTIVEEADVLLWVIDAKSFAEDDQHILENLKKQTQPLVIALNKQDQVEEEALFALAQKISLALPKAQIIPCSARTGFHCEKILPVLRELLPEQAFIYSDELVTDKSEKFYAAEMVREKIMRHTGDELPYACTIEIEKYAVENRVLHIYATIWVDKENQKSILVGKGGERLKTIGQEARIDLEKFWDQKVFLKLWIKVKKPGFIPPIY